MDHMHLLLLSLTSFFEIAASYLAIDKVICTVHKPCLQCHESARMMFCAHLFLDTDKLSVRAHRQDDSYHIPMNRKVINSMWFFWTWQDPGLKF